MSALATLINGEPAAQLACSDRGLQYGDGVFETLTCIDGRPRWLPLHLERLRLGCQRLRLRFDSFAQLRGEVQRLAAGQARSIVKVIVTRGAALRRGYAPAGDETPTRIVSRYDWATPAATAGFRVRISSVRLGMNPLLAGLKHLNRLEQVLAQLAPEAAGCDEVLMLSSAGQVISGSMSNVFFVDESGLFTPELCDCGVAGIMRRLVLEAAAARGTRARVATVTPAELGTVREAFVTNVRWGLQSVAMLEGRALPDDEHARRLQGLIDAARP